MTGWEATRETVSSAPDLAAGISIHALDDDGGGVLFDSTRQAIFSANPSALAIWRGLEDRLSPGEVAEVLSKNTSLARATARQYVAAALWQWRGWRRKVESENAAAVQRPGASRLEAALLPRATAVVRCYRLLDSGFTLRFDARVGEAGTVAALRHLQCDTSHVRTEHDLDILPLEQGYAVTEAGEILYGCSREEEILPMVKAAFIDRAMADCNGLGALHGAALSRNGRCMLFPGASGSGKSCLSATLAAGGYTLLGDDTLVLNRDATGLRPMPFGICIKDTAQDLLAGFYPDIGDLPRHARPDGKQVHYLTPPRIAVAEIDLSYPVSGIIFPTVAPNRPSRLERIAPNEALHRMVANFTPLGPRLEAADIDRLIAWMARTPCYSLEMSSLEAARELLDGLPE